MDEGIILDYVTLNHWAKLLKLGPQLLVGTTTTDVAYVELGGGFGFPSAHLHVHGQAIEHIMVKVANGFLSLGFVFHVDEAEVLHDVAL